MMLDDINKLILKNRDIVLSTGIKDCHCMGLYSFILDFNPKIRLFISDNSDISNDYNIYDPIIPIHPHKYNDYFFQLRGYLEHHLYKIDDNGFTIKKWGYPRISGGDIEFLGFEKLSLIRSEKNINFLKSNVLHSASVNSGISSWIIVESGIDNNFKQISYHNHLKSNKDLYKKFDKDLDWILDKING